MGGLRLRRIGGRMYPPFSPLSLQELQDIGRQLIAWDGSSAVPPGAQRANELIAAVPRFLDSASTEIRQPSSGEKFGLQRHPPCPRCHVRLDYLIELPTRWKTESSTVVGPTSMVLGGMNVPVYNGYLVSSMYSPFLMMALAPAQQRTATLPSQHHVVFLCEQCGGVYRVVAPG